VSGPRQYTRRAGFLGVGPKVTCVPQTTLPPALCALSSRRLDAMVPRGMTGSTISVLIGFAAGGAVAWAGGRTRAIASASPRFRRRIRLLGWSVALVAILWLMLFGDEGAWATLAGGLGLGVALGSVVSLALWPHQPKGAIERGTRAPDRPSSTPDWSEPQVYALGPFEMAVSAAAAEGVQFSESEDADRYTWTFAAIDEVALSLIATVLRVGNENVLDAQVQAEWTDWLAASGHPKEAEHTVERTIDGHRVVTGEAQHVSGASPDHEADWLLFWATQVGPYLFLAQALIGHLPEGATPSEAAAERARCAADGIVSSAIQIAIARERVSQGQI
jgi:hypothetical protein